MTKVFRFVLYLVAIVYAAITLGPFIWSIITSLKPTSELDSLSINLKNLTFGNYNMIIS